MSIAPVILIGMVESPFSVVLAMWNIPSAIVGNDGKLISVV